jgi:predicted ATPase
MSVAMEILNALMKLAKGNRLHSIEVVRVPMFDENGTKMVAEKITINATVEINDEAGPDETV